MRMKIEFKTKESKTELGNFLASVRNNSARPLHIIVLDDTTLEIVYEERGLIECYLELQQYIANKGHKWFMAKKFGEVIN